MKAAVIYKNGGPKALRCEEVPEPDCPDGCVVVNAEAISRDSSPGGVRSGVVQRDHPVAHRESLDVGGNLAHGPGARVPHDLA